MTNNFSDKKKRLPDSDAKWEYPYNHVKNTLGGHEFHVNDTPDEETIRNFHTAGTFEETDKNGTKVSLIADQSFNYTNQGTTNTSEAASDNFSEADRSQARFGSHSENAGDVSSAVFGQTVSVNKGSTYTHSENKGAFVYVQNKFSEMNDANDHNNIEGDKVTFMVGTKYEQIKGEYGTHMPSGNYDLQVDGGKIRLNSAQMILIEVGSSVIKIEPSQITIKAAAVKFEKA